ncbi:MAG: cysteinyl-tRNA synthetase [Cyclobacteriaceae bacterium]|jgi:cysteinyl-tRNA synthetase
MVQFKKADDFKGNAVFSSAVILLAIFLLGSCAAKKELVSLKQDHQSLQDQMQQLKENNNELEVKTNEFEQNESSLNEENVKLKKRLLSARESLNELSNQELECPEAMIKGVVFKVQIGAFKEREISKELDQSINLGIEGKKEFDKVVIGQFRDYKKADILRNHLQAMGIEDAWVVPYRNNVRVELSEVLDETGL